MPYRLAIRGHGWRQRWDDASEVFQVVMGTERTNVGRGVGVLRVGWCQLDLSASRSTSYEISDFISLDCSVSYELDHPILSWQRYCGNVHSTIIHNSSKMKTVEMSIGWRIDEYNVLQTSMEYYSAIKTNNETCYKMEKSQKHSTY